MTCRFLACITGPFIKTKKTGRGPSCGIKILNSNLPGISIWVAFEILKWKYQKDSQIDCSELSV